MKTKKWLMVLTLVIFTMGSLIACSSGGSNQGGEGQKGGDTPAPPPADDNTPITIEYWHAHSGAQQAGVDYIIEQFNKKYPHITVKDVFQGGYGDTHKKILAAVAARQVPALGMVEVSVLPQFADGGVFTDLGPYIKRDNFDTKDFSEGMLKTYAYEGTQYGLPVLVSAAVNIYNKTLLDKEGVKPPETWADVEEFGKKLTIKKGNEVERYAYSVPGWSAWYYDMWISNGGGSLLSADAKKSNLDAPESMKYLKTFKDWMDKGYLYMGYGSGASDTMRQMFLNEKIAMVEHSSAVIKTYVENASFEVGVSFIPGDKSRSTNIGGGGVGILDLASDKEKEAAWKFLQFLTSPEHNIKWADFVGYLPTRKSAIESAEGKEYFSNKPQYKAVFDHFDNVQARLQHPGYPEFRKAHEAAVGKVILEGADPETVLKEASKQITDILKDY